MLVGGVKKSWNEMIGIPLLPLELGFETRCEDN